jgi:hypothetical protein
VIAVLLNGVGHTIAHPFGYADSGFAGVVFDDQANHDVHNYRLTLEPVGFGPLTGNWRPDARAASPGAALDSDPRTATFAQFNGLNPNGNWTLFVADLSSGGTARLQSWSLEITAVPEPGNYTAVFGLGLLGILILKRLGAWLRG